MTADTSVMGAIGQAMGKAAHGAVLGRAIGQLKDEASEAIDLANGWQNYAKRLELQVSQLQGTVQSVAETAQEKIAEVADLKLKVIRLQGTVQSVAETAKEKIAEIADLELERIETNEKLAHAKLHRKINFSQLEANEAYGKQFQFRLRQMEKALQHSSSDKEALRSILKVYEKVIERLNLADELPNDLKEKTETAWNQFMNGEDLTVDEDIQKLIDEAPIPKRPSGATY